MVVNINLIYSYTLFPPYPEALGSNVFMDNIRKEMFLEAETKYRDKQIWVALTSHL